MPQAVMSPAEVDVPTTLAVQLDCVAASSPAGIGAVMRAAFPRVDAYLRAHGLQCTGAPRAIYTTFTAAETCFTLAIPCAPPAAPLAEEEGVSVRELQAVHALCFTHHGPYDQLGATYRDITMWLMKQGLIESEAGWSRFAAMWEEYVSDPTVVPPSELVTHIYLPLG